MAKSIMIGSVIRMKRTLALVLAMALTGPLALVAETLSVPMLFYGEASWYGSKFNGRKTANGETYDMTLLTAAHRTLPFGTLVRVTNLENDKSVTVRVNDRGPFAKDRVIDISQAAAGLLDFQNKGTAKVEVRVVQLGDGKMRETASAAAVPGLDADRATAVTPAVETATNRDAATLPADTAATGSASLTARADGDGPKIVRPEDVRTKDLADHRPDNRVDAATDGKVVIQAGAFLSLDNAEGLLRRLEAAGFAAFLRQLSGERLQRVWVGPFATQAKANASLERVRRIAAQAFVRNRE